MPAVHTTDLTGRVQRDLGGLRIPSPGGNERSQPGDQYVGRARPVLASVVAAEGVDESDGEPGEAQSRRRRDTNRGDSGDTPGGAPSASACCPNLLDCARLARARRGRRGVGVGGVRCAELPFAGIRKEGLAHLTCRRRTTPGSPARRRAAARSGRCRR